MAPLLQEQSDALEFLLAEAAREQQQQQAQQQQQQQQRGAQMGYGDPPQLSSGGLQVYDDPFERMMNVNGRQRQLASHYV